MPTTLHPFTPPALLAAWREKMQQRAARAQIEALENRTLPRVVHGLEGSGEDWVGDRERGYKQHRERVEQ